LYVWTDFPISYVTLGMVPYFLAVPLGLVATGVFGRYCARGGGGLWTASAGLMAVGFLGPFTIALLVVPAALVGYPGAARRGVRRRAGGCVGEHAAGSGTSRFGRSPHLFSHRTPSGGRRGSGLPGPKGRATLRSRTRKG